MLPFNQSRTPTYDLEDVQRLVGQGPISCRVSAAAFAGADELDLEPGHVIEAVLALNARDFYKSMPAERAPGLWQDVYHLRYAGFDLYIKVQINAAGQAVVVQFKKR